MVHGASGEVRRREVCEETGKVRWIGPSGAAHEAMVMRKHEGRGSTLEHYRCEHCRDWHVGHRRRRNG